MKIHIKTKLVRLGIFIFAMSTLMLGSPVANAVPSFARQTGMSCASCHTVYPELTSFGRQFKLNGYTFTGLQQIQQASGDGTGGLKISAIPPLSAMLLVGGTHLNKSQPDTQNDNVQFPDQLSFFFAGEITPKIGSFLQITYSQADDHIGWDNADIRYANRTTVGGADTTYGLTLNNNPTVEDPWNSTTAWGFPFVSSSTAPGPAASAIVDGKLAQDVAGVGAYAFWNNHLYGNLTLYRSAHVGQGAPDSTSTNTIQGSAPYIRIAWEQALGDTTLQIGAYGMSAKLYPTGVSGPTDDYTDSALDAQYEVPLSGNLLTLHTSYIHEQQTLNATDSGAEHKLNTFRINGIYHWGNEATAGMSYYKTSGDSNSALWGTANGKPDSTAWVAELDYLPWQNTKFGLQYTKYAMFDGTADNASDNNTTYLFGWFMW